MGLDRLQKVLARAGIASRRAAERLIVEGRVTVNGSVVNRLGIRVDADRDAIKVDGKRLRPAPAHRTWILLNKPRGFVTTARDPENRPTVLDLMAGVGTRVFPVGRLDFHTEGLLLLTDDGDLARDLIHPASHVPKTYLAKVRGMPGPDSLARLAGGVSLDGRRTLPARARIVRPGANAWVEVTVVEGRKHQVRRMLERIGHPVLRLRRTGFGPLSLGRLPAGRHRSLTAAEVAALRDAVRPGLPRGARRGRGRRG